ncbi:MAG: hypothetical protein ACP5K9_02720 [Candidatus Micrarchaeia archaeon]
MAAPEDAERIIDEYSGMISRGMANAIADGEGSGKNVKIGVGELISSSELPQSVDIEDNVYRVFNKWQAHGSKNNYYRRMVLGSEGNTVNVTLWGAHSDLADSLPIERGDTIVASNLTVRKWQGSIELASTASTSFSRVKYSSTGITDYSKIAPGSKEIDIIGKIVEVGTAHSFTTLSGRQGSVSDCIITDGKLTMRVVLWDSSSYYANSMKPGSYVKIEFAIAKQAAGATEIHAGNNSRVLVSQKLMSRLRGSD